MNKILILITLVLLHPKDFQLMGYFSEPCEAVAYYEAIQYLPDKMFNRLVYQNWSVNFIDNIDEIYPHAIGYYNTYKKEVYIDSKKIQSCCSNAYAKTVETIIHELVHAFDYEQDNPSIQLNEENYKEVLAYNMTDWLLGKSVEEKYRLFFENLINN